ncbi:MAG: hypothetical protein K0Q72_5189 [Armatimonadetes bacterium]|jgi:hypothetical protein|nr:hypothetical protein [Armatimonadota bacterium]
MHGFILITEIVSQRGGRAPERVRLERAIAAAACACPDPFFLLTRERDLDSGSIAVAYYTNIPSIRDRVHATFPIA